MPTFLNRTISQNWQQRIERKKDFQIEQWVYRYTKQHLTHAHQTQSDFISTMNTLKFLNSFSINDNTFASDISNIRSKFYDSGVCWTDDVRGQFVPGTPFRVILYTRKGQVDFKNPMVKECNGLVLTYNGEWKALAIPQGAFCTNKISMKKLNDLYVAGGYEIYEALDATILTLYYYNHGWRMSSTKSYDIGDSEMVSGMSFMEAFQDLMDTKYKSFRFENLNKSYSYTIALRHSKYHIFDETKHLAIRTNYVPKPGVDMNSYIMSLYVVDTTSGISASKHVPGIPQQNPISFKDNTIHTLVNYARSAYSKYAKAYRLQNFKYKPLYGYILRSKHRSVPVDYSTIYIESELFKIIKLGLYKNNQPLINNDFNQLIIQMSMDHERYDQYKIAFQQFHSKFEQLETSINAMATEVIQRIIQDSDDSDSDMAMVDDTNLEMYQQLINGLVEEFKNEPNISSGIVKDALYSKQYNSFIQTLLA